MYGGDLLFKRERLATEVAMEITLQMPVFIHVLTIQVFLADFDRGLPFHILLILIICELFIALIQHLIIFGNRFIELLLIRCGLTPKRIRQVRPLLQSFFILYLDIF